MQENALLGTNGHFNVLVALGGLHVAYYICVQGLGFYRAHRSVSMCLRELLTVPKGPGNLLGVDSVCVLWLWLLSFCEGPGGLCSTRCL